MGRITQPGQKSSAKTPDSRRKIADSIPDARSGVGFRAFLNFEFSSL